MSPSTVTNLAAGRQGARRDLRKELDSYTDERPETWDPAPGDMLVGTLLRYKEVNGRHGRSVLAIIADEDANSAPVGVWITPTVLRQEFTRLRPRPSERIGIKRMADHDSRRGTCKVFF